MENLTPILAAHPRLGEWLRPTLSVQRLGGLTNQNLLVDTPRGKFVLRLPGAGTDAYINRAWEKHAAELTSSLGINAPVLYFDPKSGIQLCRFLEGAQTMSHDGFQDLGKVRRAAHALRQVHESKAPFLNRFELFAMMDGYLTILDEKKAELPAGFHELKAEASVVREALNRHPLPLAPCHCDPLAENFLDDGARSYVIDWEYSGNNDPMWDLGDLSVEAGFNREQDEQLLAGYFSNGECRDFDRGRMILYKAMCDLLWTLWGVIQHTNRNPADDFWSYACQRFQRCQTLMHSPDFSRHLAAVQAGPQPVLETLPVPNRH